MGCKYSFIIPVYNREKYIRETIDSVLNQKFDLSKVEIVLVDDGSTDNSLKICKEYESKYSDLIRVIHQENAGASAARITGINAARGEWANFLDSDDKLSSNTLKEVDKFIRKHGEEVDVVAIPIFFFGVKNGSHILNYKFKKGNRVIDLKMDWENPQLSLASSFINVSNAREMSFKKPLHITSGEDAIELLYCMLSKQTLGVVSKAKYLYRQHDEASLLGSAMKKKSSYSDNLQAFHMAAINNCKNILGEVPLFVQNILMYDLQWRIKQSKFPMHLLSEDEIDNYKQLLVEILQEIDDEVILKQRNIWSEHKSYALYKKKEVFPDIIYDEKMRVAYAYGNDEDKYLRMSPLRLTYIEQRGDKINIVGWIPQCLFLTEQLHFVEIEVNGELVDVNWEKVSVNNYALEEPIVEAHWFSFSFSALETSRISFYCVVGGKRQRYAPIKSQRYFPLNMDCKFAYAMWNGFCLFQNYREDIVVKKAVFRNPIREILYLINLMSESKRGMRQTAIVRMFYFIAKLFLKERVWLFSDRYYVAGDNGETLFEYVNKCMPRGVKTYYLLGKDSKDYKRLEKIGNVVEPFSIKHRILFLLSEYFISSQADQMYVFPFRGYKDAYKDIASSKFVFLQHGVTKDNISSWVNKYSKNIFGFVTSAHRESESIVSGEYYYDTDTVWEVGMSRFDNRVDDREKLIVIAPTWRNYLAGILKSDGSRGVAGAFFESDYMKYYEKFLSNEKLKNAALYLGYRIVFYPHPNMKEFCDLLTVDSNVIEVGLELEYKDLYNRASLFVTDYSSVVFDFAYMYKPVLYTQFDKDEFFAGNHSYTQGYFDYERDGFGEVAYDLDSTVDLIIEYMENDCQMKDKYRKRVDEFFTYHDHNNCQRTYEKLLECSGK